MQPTPSSDNTSDPQPPTRLWNRNFFLLWQGQAISQLGNQAFLIAMELSVKEVTGSATLMGGLMALFFLPVLIAPFGGTFADRQSRIRIIVICDMLAAIVSLSLGLVMAYLGIVSLLLPFLFTASLLIGIIRSFFTPALQAMIPDLVPSQRLTTANSLNRLPVIAGKGLGGILYQRLGATLMPLMFIMDGTSSLLASVSSMFVNETWKRPHNPSSRFLRETKEGLRYVWGRTGMRDLVLGACLLNVLGTPIFVLLPFYADTVFGSGAAGYGYLQAAISIGTVVGFLLVGVVPLKEQTLGWTLISGLLFGQLFLSALGFVSVSWVALALCFASGLSLGVFNVHLLTLLQKLSPKELRGRVQGLLNALFLCLNPLGAVLGGWLGDLTGKDVPSIFGGVGALCVLVTLALATRREFRNFLAQGASEGNQGKIPAS